MPRLWGIVWLPHVVRRRVSCYIPHLCRKLHMLFFDPFSVLFQILHVFDFLLVWVIWNLIIFQLVLPGFLLKNHGRLARSIKWRACDVGEAKEGLENELWAEFILQPFRHFTYVTAHSPTFPSLYLRHSSFSNPSVALPTSQLILQHFRRFTYVTAHSPTLPSLYLRHSSFSNPSVALPTSQLILQPFRCFTYVIVHSPTLLWLLLRHRIFTYVTWRAAHADI